MKKKFISIFMTAVMLIGILGMNIGDVFADESTKDINVNIAVVGMYNEVLFSPQQVKVTENATAEDVLKATGLSENINDKGMITSIANEENGKDDGNYGSQSGWMYKVNYTVPQVYPREQSVKDGDYLLFVYVKDMSDLLPSYDSIQNNFVNVTVKSTEKDNSFSEPITVLKDNSINAAIMESLKKHGEDFDKSSLSSGALMSKDDTQFWSYILNDDKNTYNEKDTQLKDGDVITTFKDDGQGIKSDEPSTSPQSVEVYPGNSFTLNISSEKGNILAYNSDIAGMNSAFNPISDGKVTIKISQDVKPGEYTISNIGLYNIPSNIPPNPQIIVRYINDQYKIASLQDVKVVVKEQSKVNVESITLDKSQANLVEGDTLQLNATVNPNDATNKTVDWTSSDSTIATIDNTGKVTAVKEGTSTITATTVDGEKTATCSINVQNKTIHISMIIDGYKGNILTDESIEANSGETLWNVLKRELTNKGITYINDSESSPYISMIADESQRDREASSGWKYSVNGIFPNASCGSYELKDGDKIHWIFVRGSMDETAFRDVDSISLDKENLNLKVNDTQQLVATVNPDNATDKDVTWTSSDETVAKVDDKGKVTALKAGSATIIAGSVDNSKRYKINYAAKTTSCALTVSDNTSEVTTVASISLDTTSASITAGDTKQLNASIQPDNASNKAIIWTSSDPTIATVDNTGKVTAVKEGTVSITATTVDGEKTAVCSINVKSGQSKDYTIDITNLTTGSAFTLGGDAKVSVNAENNIDKDQDVSLIIALYNDKNQFVNYVCGKQTIKKGDSSILTGIMKLPVEGAYKLRAFVWNSLDTMNPLSDTIEIPVK